MDGGPGVSIKPGGFDKSEFSAGRLPANQTSMSFPAVQTYSDRKVVKWDEPAARGAAEPKHPAPVLNLLPAKSSEHSPAVAVPSKKAAGSDSVARGLGAGAIVVAAGGLGLGLRRKKRAVTQ